MNNLLSRLKAIQLPETEVAPQVVGKLTRVVGLTLEAVGLKVAVGDRCRIELPSGDMEAEVVGFSGETIYLMPTEKVDGVTPGAAVYPITSMREFPYGTSLTRSCYRWYG